MIRTWLLLCCGLFLVWSGDAAAKRVALVIGNSNYGQSSSLANPVNDAQLIAGAAKRAGFDEVVTALDLDVQAFQRALRDFRQKANGADVAMVYYAGHGIEGQGKNWLIPVDAELKASLDLPYEAIDLDRVMESLNGAQIRMVVLDACRNNPFARSWRSGTRSLTRGLIGVEADDVLVIYAAAPGQTAADGDGINSPFAQSLAKRLPQPDLPVQLLGGTVRDDVLSATGGTQRPFVSASITGTPVYLVPRTQLAGIEQTPVSAGQQQRQSQGPQTADREALSWQGAMSANTIPAYQAYLADFPEGQFAALARENISSLGAKPTAQAAMRGSEKGNGLAKAGLPYRDMVAPGKPMAIDGVWTISTLNKRLKIEKGRAYALDGWIHAQFWQIVSNMVVHRDIKRIGTGRYVGRDLSLNVKSRFNLLPDGNIKVRLSTFPFATHFVLLKESLDQSAAMDSELALLAAEK
ncbi:MAG: caspase family protein [Parasphingorhabdus sp.]|uniref:caspase family protein n=1 Tax=Parasphingorhabdus sp. TaxID=2709688 RepID=UPI003299026A